jgi:hypothetical protein
MIAVGIALVMLVTGDTRERCVRACIGVTLRALRPLTSMSARIDLEILRVVIEGRWRPCGGRVTCLALVAETGDDVVWICRTGKIRLMTLVTIRVHQLIVAVDVTRLTLSC